jgi:hypothetical protein
MREVSQTRKNQIVRKWYENHKEAFNARRREKYAASKQLRKKAVDRAKEYRDSHHNDNTGSIISRIVDGKEILLYSVGAAALHVERTPQIFKTWESKGWIPASVLPGFKHRYYTMNQIMLMKKLLEDGPTKDTISYIHSNWGDLEWL